MGTLTQGWFESNQSFAKRVAAAGGSDGAKARQTLKDMAERDRKTAEKKAKAEREARVTRESLKKRREEKNAKNRHGDSWW